MYTWGHLQRLLYRAKLRDGDAGVLLTEEKGGDGTWHPRLQLIESEHIDNPYGGYGDKDAIDGVVLNANDSPSAFLLRVFDEDNKETSQRFKARDFIFLTRPTLYSGVRGESAFNGGWSLFDSIIGYLEATVVTARVGACQSLFVKKNSPAAASPACKARPRAATARPARACRSSRDDQLPGAGRGDRRLQPDPARQNFPDAIAAFARFVGLRFGLTLEQVLLDFSRTNYSSARAARIQAEQTAYQEQDDFAARSSPASTSGASPSG
jgi:capsid protein